MRSVNRILVISAVLASVGILIVFGALFLSRRIASHYQPEKRLLAPTVLPTLIPTLTLAPGQKAICTYYIQATSHETSPKGLALTLTDSGKTFTVDIGTLLILYCKAHNFHISASSSQDIFEGAGSKNYPIHLPLNAKGAFRVIRAGFGIIQVIGTE